MRMIYVSGAPGNVGTELVRRLSAMGESVRVLVHRAENEPLLAFPHVEVVHGDLADPQSFRSSLAGAERVFVNSSVGPAIQAQVNLIEAAREVGARHIVKLSWLGASERSFIRSFGRWHAEVERRLQESGAAYTILRASDFMQNYLPQIAMTAPDVAWGAAAGGKASLVDARDVAAVAAVVLTETGHEGKIYEVTGPEALTKAEAFAVIARVTGRRVSYRNVSPEHLANAYQLAGWPEPWADELVAADELQAAGGLDRVTDVVQSLTGKPPRTFEQFVQESAARAPVA
jgi:uncharacterized protein YbjT (DUF2867 family)